MIRSVAGRALSRGVLAYATVTRTLARWTDHSIAGLEGLVSHALTPAEREAITIAINAQHRRSERRALFDWEQRMFAEDLPAPPARVLLGGSGDGAQAVPLRAAGYEVHTFEPAASCLAQLAAAVGPTGSASLLDYRELLTGSSKAATTLRARRYDAVILGWISLSHLLEADTREALFELVSQLCPDGPILFSFNLTHDSEPARQSRAFQLGTRAGATLAQLRALPTVNGADRERFWPHAGFVHLFSQRELERLARACGRTLDVRSGPFPHAVLRAT